jgi:signal transduction histidine kinase
LHRARWCPQPVLHRIADAAAEALGAMRRTVGVLRTDRETEHPTTGDLAALSALVDDFGQTHGLRVTLHHGTTIPDTLPHEVQTAAYRVTREGLTNIGRHAPDATEATVHLGHYDGQLHVTSGTTRCCTGCRNQACGACGC